MFAVRTSIFIHRMYLATYYVLPWYLRLVDRTTGIVTLEGEGSNPHRGKSVSRRSPQSSLALGEIRKQLVEI